MITQGRTEARRTSDPADWPREMGFAFPVTGAEIVEKGHFCIETSETCYRGTIYLAPLPSPL
jgi:hypothetical protein